MCIHSECKNLLNESSYTSLVLRIKNRRKLLTKVSLTSFKYPYKKNDNTFGKSEQITRERTFSADEINETFHLSSSFS